MYKNILIACSTVIAIVFFIVVTFVFKVGFFPLPHVPHNRNIDRELNRAIIDLVEQVTQVQYHTHCRETMEQIFTSHLLENYDNYHHDFFRDVRPVYVNRNYMRSMPYIGDGEWHVIVTIHEGRIWSGESFFLHIHVIETEEGSYQIHRIGRDR